MEKGNSLVKIETIKKVVIHVKGGIVEIEYNPYDLNVKILDYDNGDVELTFEECIEYDAIISVTGGVAHIDYKISDVDIIINDLD